MLKSTLFGVQTNYKPLWLLGMGAAGNALYGTGTLAIERSIYPRKLLRQPGQLEAPPPFFNPLFGSRTAGLAVGGLSTIAGVGLAALSCALFYQDTRRLAFKQTRGNPSYARANWYLAAHITGITLSVGAQFIKEALRDGPVTGDYTWIAALPGIIGASLFSVTQAQAASNCEILNARMPLSRRSELGFAARCGVAGYTVYAAFMSVPNFNVYAREVMRLFAQSCTTLAYSLPLTTARLGRQQGVDFVSHQPEPSWYALKVLGLYIAGRVVAGFGPDLIQQGLFQQENRMNAYVFGGAASMTAGTAACVAALMMFRTDVSAYAPRRANLLVGGACFALLCILTYTGIAQYAQSTRQPPLLWGALAPGVVGAGLRLAILPILFSFAELRMGDAPVPYRYQWTEACRALGSTCFGIWGVLSAIPNANNYGKEAVAVAAGTFATLGMALPTTTSRRAMPSYAWPLSPPATPMAEVEGFSLD